LRGGDTGINAAAVCGLLGASVGLKGINLRQVDKITHENDKIAN
jgi:hypothetical protein